MTVVGKMHAVCTWALVVATAVAVAAERECSGPTVTVTQGRICGVTTKDYHKYQGIPYAEPPVGQLRWKNPVPMRSWMGVRQCTRECNICLQAQSGTSIALGAEDCLCLNVFVPKNPKMKSIPVMVFIQGGSFVSDSGNADKYNPVELVAKGVIVVTLNYRLGTLGFLNLGSLDAPGNQGLKDQVLALQWVNNNIKAFGGDPGSITVFGQSAGSMCVHLLTLSPMARGLFVRAITESGSALNPGAFNETTQCSNERLLDYVKCPVPVDNNTTGTIDCLLAVNASVLQVNTPMYICEETDRTRGTFAFAPSLDGEFLPMDPITLAAECNDVPMIVGYNSAEGLVGLPALQQYGYSAWTKRIADGIEMEQFGTNCSWTTARLKAWGANASQHFLGGQPLSESNIEGFVQYLSFFAFIWGIDVTIEMRAKCPNAPPQYLYLFNVSTVLNYVKHLVMADQFRGAAHGDELPYIFNYEIYRGLTCLPRDAQLAKKQLVALWTNFAIYGNPTPKTDKVITTRWRPYSPKERNYLHIKNGGIQENNNPFDYDTQFYKDLISTCQ